MALKTGMLVGIVGSSDLGVLIQIREASQTCVIKLNNGTLKKNVPLADVEEAKDMSDTKEKKSPIRLEAPSGAGASSTSPKPLALPSASPHKSPAKPGSPKALAPLSSGPSPKSKPSAFNVGDRVKARHWKVGDRWTSAKVTRVRSDGSVDVEFDDGKDATRVPSTDIKASDDNGGAQAKPTSSSSASSLSPKKSSTTKKTSAMFDVGDAIQARYKNGKRMFPGKIAAVNSDGTYDILYDDGDTEPRVVEASIERAAGSSDTKTRPKSPAKATFRLNQAVRAKYKMGSRWFAGKIKKVNTDGTFDVLYEDGDMELRVEREFIEGVEEEVAESPREVASRTKSSLDSKQSSLGVGAAVKARYKKGSKLFSGKITKVRTDGTYEIRYEDGDVEMRVEREFIESVRQDEEEDSKSTASEKQPAGFEVGDRVQAYYKGGRSLYSGRITKKYPGGKYDVTYDDGDLEQRVAANLIQATPKSPGKSDSERQKLSPKSPEFNKGDKVKAKYKGGSKYFPGTIARCREDKTYDIEYDDGDVETRVEASRIEAVETETKKSPKKLDKLGVGDAIKARYKGGKKMFGGKISKVNRDGTYDIKYEDGDTEMRVAGDLIESVENQPSDAASTTTKNSPVKKRLKVGAKIRARYKGGSKLFNGEIILARTDGSFDIKYEDGDSEKHVEADMIELVDDGEASRYEVGQNIQAYYKGGKKLFSGKIARVNSDGTYDIKYSDGDSETRIPANQIVVETPEKPVKSGFVVGDKVKARYKGGSKLFPGKISRVHTNGTYDIKYDDGDSETRVDPAIVVAYESDGKPKQTESTESPRRYEVGDTVNARYKGGTKLFAAKISRVRSDGTYDLEYNDGDSETRVSSDFIERVSDAANKKTDSKRNELGTGAKVRARYKKGAKWFPAKITKVRTDGTFDLRYDDGDEELRVDREYIEPEVITKKTSNDDDEDLFGDDDENDRNGKKNSSAATFKKGSAVEANFKKKGKFHRGKIVKVHSDGTFDIEYDAGASEKRVERHEIRKLAEGSDGEVVSASKARNSDHPDSKDTSSKNDSRDKESKSTGTRNSNLDSEAENSPRQLFQIGMRVTLRMASDTKSKRVGTVKRIHRDGSCDVRYPDGDTSKRLKPSELLLCSDSEDSESETSPKKHKGSVAATAYKRNQKVLCNWRRPSKFASARQTGAWKKAKIIAIHGDNTFTVSLSMGVGSR